jgi:hypothetical protein
MGPTKERAKGWLALEMYSGRVTEYTQQKQGLRLRV